MIEELRIHTNVRSFTIESLEQNSFVFKATRLEEASAFNIYLAFAVAIKFERSVIATAL